MRTRVIAVNPVVDERALAEANSIKVYEALAAQGRYEIFSKRLKAQMRKAKMDPRSLSRESGVPGDYLSAYLKGKTMPRPSTLEKLAAALGCEVEALSV